MTPNTIPATVFLVAQWFGGHIETMGVFLSKPEAYNYRTMIAERYPNRLVDVVTWYDGETLE